LDLARVDVAHPSSIHRKLPRRACRDANWYIDWQPVDASLLELGDLAESLIAETPRRDYLSLVAAGEPGLALEYLCQLAR
jgi:hypothetical protein